MRDKTFDKTFTYDDGLFLESTVLHLLNFSKLYMAAEKTYNIATCRDPDILLHSTESPYQLLFYIYHHCHHDAVAHQWMDHICMSIVREAAVATFS